MSLSSDILRVVLQHSTTLPCSLACLSSTAKLDFLPWMKELHLTKAVKLSQLLDLFGECSHTPLISGLLIVDLPIEVVPWSCVHYGNLTLCLTETLYEPEFLLPLFSMAIRDASKTLKIYSQEDYLIGEAEQGYVSECIVTQVRNQRKLSYYHLEGDKLIINRSGSSGKRAKYTCHHILIESWNLDASIFLWFPNLETIKARRPCYFDCEDLPGCANLGEIGANIFLHVDNDYPEHPNLRRINIETVNQRGNIQRALDRGYEIVLYAPPDLLPLYKTRYASCKQIVEYQAFIE